MQFAQEGAVSSPAAAGSITQATVPEQVQELPPKVPEKERSPAIIGGTEPVFAKAPAPLNEQDRAGNLKRVFDASSMTVSPTASGDMPVLCTFGT